MIYKAVIRFRFVLWATNGRTDKGLLRGPQGPKKINKTPQLFTLPCAITGPQPLFRFSLSQAMPQCHSEEKSMPQCTTVSVTVTQDHFHSILVSMQLKAAHGVKSSDKYHMTELTYGPQTTLFIFVLWDFTKLKPCSPTLSIHTNCCIFFFFNFLVFSIFGFPQQQIMVGPLLAPCQLSIFHQSLD